MNQIKTGIFGLDPLLHGGFSPNSVIVTIGRPGTGKTTASLQFLRKGLEWGENAVFITLDENEDQIIQEATVRLDWPDIRDYIDEKRLFFVDITGQNFIQFVNEELEDYVSRFKGSNLRIVIDPLTPLLWSVKENYERREILLTLFKGLKKVGTVFTTLEEYGTITELPVTPETTVPMYLGDTVIHLIYGVMPNLQHERNLRILKSRNTKHSTKQHRYLIVKGLGMVVVPETAREPWCHVSEASEVTEWIEKLAFPPIVRERLANIVSELSAEEYTPTDIRALLEMLKKELA